MSELNCLEPVSWTPVLPRAGEQGNAIVATPPHHILPAVCRNVWRAGVPENEEASATMPGEHRTTPWTTGPLVGLGAAALGTLALLAAGASSGRGLHILADAGHALLPTALRTVTGASAVVGYLLTHSLLYMLAGVVALALAGLADRSPQVVAALVLVVIFLEFGFLELTTEVRTMGRLDEITWRCLLIVHAVGDLVLALGILRVHPSLRQALVRGYEE